MKFGLRTPSLKKRIAARTSWKRVVRHSLGLKAPRGMGLLTNPKKALYNRVYSRTTVGVDKLLKVPKTRKGSSPRNANDDLRPGIEISNTGNIIRSSSKALTVTSKNFAELRNQVTDIYNKRMELNKELRSAKVKLYALTAVHLLSFPLIVGFFYKKIAEMRTDQQKLVKKLEELVSQTYVKLAFADKTQLEKSWLNCIDAFDELMKSEKIWDLTYAESVDKAKARTIAQTATKRTLINGDDKKVVDFIKSDLPSLYLANSNGPDLFFFPTFLLLYKGSQEFGIFDLKEIKAAMKLTGYVEEEKVPGDTEVIQHTWKKTNKDGSRDRRFKGNYQIPIVKYGDLTLTSEMGLEESFMFSNFDAFTEFAKTFEHHTILLEKIK